jgi:hypothetical protein
MIELQRIKWIFDPNDSHQTFTHAQVPTPLVLEDRIRVFFSGRINGISHIYSIDIEPPPKFSPMLETLKIAMYPNTNIGTFDDEGVMPSCFITKDKIVYHYYSGWNSRNTIPYHNSTGMAVYDERTGELLRKFEGPVLERNYLHPYLAVTPTIWHEGDCYRALYISGLQWKKGADRYEPVYVIKEAYSQDLINWTRPFEQVIKSDFSDECFSNPSVYVDKVQNTHVLFCSRASMDFRSNQDNSYKIGYAKKSMDGYMRGRLTWSGKDKSSKEEAMQAYPHFFEWAKELFVLYNGNGFGLSGFGVARVHFGDQ